jgi:hypothetical protein
LVVPGALPASVGQNDFAAILKESLLDDPQVYRRIGG